MAKLVAGGAGVSVGLSSCTARPVSSGDSAVPSTGILGGWTPDIYHSQHQYLHAEGIMLMPDLINDQRMSDSSSRNGGVFFFFF